MRTQVGARRSWRVAVAVAAGALVLAACGDDDSSGSADTTAATATSAAATTAAATTASAETTAGSATTAKAATTTAKAATTTAKASEDPAALVADLIDGTIDFPRPDTPVDPGQHDVAVVAAGLASPGPARVADEISKALDLIGWEAPPAYDGKFQPTEQAAGIQTAVNDGADAIFLIAITPSAVSAAVGAAQDAGIPIVCVLCGPDAITEGITNVQADADAAGAAQAAYVMANSDGSPNVVVYHNDEFKFSSQQMDAAQAYLEENCPDCKIDERSLILAEGREPNAPMWVSLLQDHPEGELDFVLLPFDSPANALSVTAQQLGRNDFSVVGYGALSPFVDAIGTGSPEVAKTSVTISTPYFGWAAVDQAARVLAGEDTWDSGNMPVGLITKENFSRFPAGQPYEKPDFDFAQFFSEMWGK